MASRPKSILRNGGTGSFGRTMLKKLLASGAEEIRILSRDEEKQDALRSELRDSRVKYYIGDVRDRESVEGALLGVDNIGWRHSEKLYETLASAQELTSSEDLEAFKDIDQ